MKNVIRKEFPADLTLSDGERAVTGVVTADCLDRDNEVVVPSGVNLKEYDANPVLLPQHDYGALPIASCVGVKRDDRRIAMKFVFPPRPPTHPADEEWLPDTFLHLYREKVLRGFSISFMTSEVRAPNAHDLTKYGRECVRIISKCRLLEVSAVTIPSNPMAVALAVSKGALSPGAAKVLFDFEGKSNVPTVDRGPNPTEAFRRELVLALARTASRDDLAALIDLAKLLDATGTPRRDPPPREPAEPTDPKTVATIEVPPPEMKRVQIILSPDPVAPADDAEFVRMRRRGRVYI